MKELINSKSDVQKFIAALNEFSEKYEENLGFDNTSLSKNIKGETELWLENDTWYTYSSGKDWADEAPSKIDDIEEYIWNHRNQINKSHETGTNFVTEKVEQLWENNSPFANNPNP